MTAARTRPTTPNRFSLASTREHPSATLPNPDSSAPVTTRAPASPPHALPADLPSAIKHLDDQELERLLAGVLAEQRRRGKKRSDSDEISYRRQLKVVSRLIDPGKVKRGSRSF